VTWNIENGLQPLPEFDLFEQVLEIVEGGRPASHGYAAAWNGRRRWRAARAPRSDTW
jgi:hypothetical protein